MGKQDDSNGEQDASENASKGSSGEQNGGKVGSKGRLDWGAAKVMYARGHSYKEIAEHIGTTRGTVQTQAKREGWVKERRSAEELVKETAQRTLQEHAKSAAEAWSESMIEDLKETASVLREQHKPRNLHDLKTYEEVRKLHVETGRKLFGLDESDNKTLVQVNLGNLSAEDAPQGDSSASDDAIEA